jgi:hypothetical protein
MLHTASKEFFTNATLCGKMTQYLGQYNDILILGDFDLSFFPNKNITLIADPGTCLIAKKLYNVKNVFPLIFNVEGEKAEKEMLNNLKVDIVNIIQSMKDASKLKIIMNPPYNGNLHLKILRTVIDVCKGAEVVAKKDDKIVHLSSEVDEIVNLSPNFYEDYKKLDGVPVASDIDVIPREEASSLFGGIQLAFNLSIQHYVKGRQD